MKTNAIFTIVSKNYISYARVLMNSFLNYHTDCDCYVLLVDKIDGYFDPSKERFRTVELEQVEIRNRDSFIFKYDIMELNTAVKPFFFEYLFKNHGYEKVVYFDPDILILRELSHLFEILDSYSFILIPHFTSPLPDDGKRPNEIDILRAGCYNLGFLGISNYGISKKFLEWWQERLHKYCFSAPDIGLFVDQKWIDLVPSFYDGAYILKNPGYNVAYWNLHERDLSIEEENYKVNGEPLYFYHFSGIDFDNIKNISKFQNRYRLSDIENLEALFTNYKKTIIQAGYNDTRHWPYFYGFFDNGVRIPDIIRRIYHELGCPKTFGDPFKTADLRSFFRWLNSPIPTEPKVIPQVTHLLDYIYQIRPDVQRAFPDARNTERDKLIEWARRALAREYGIGDAFLQSLTRVNRAFDFSKPIGFHGGLSLFESFLWTFGNRHALMIKKIPLVRTIAKRLHSTLAKKRTTRFLNNSWKVPYAGNGKTKNQSFGMNVAGYLDTESGVGEAARGIIRSLIKSDLKFVLNNIEQHWLRRNDKTYTHFSKENPYPINLLHVNADQVPTVFAQLGETYFENKYNIGYWFWEVSNFPKEWHSSFRYFNEIWVASNFLLDALSHVSPIPVVKIPTSIEFGVRGLLDRKTLGIPDASFVFLNIFDFRSFVERKNPFALIEAFRRLYQDFPSRECLLLLKMTNTEADPGLLGQIKAKMSGLPIRLIDTYFDKDEIYDLLCLSDCYVSLHRSEGFGLPLAEAMYLRKPVIATGYSGNMDYMNINNSFPVKYNLIEIREDIGPYKKGNVWADPDIDHAVELMQLVYHDRELAMKVGKLGAEEIRTHFSPSAIGEIIQQRVDLILSKLNHTA
jgi:glycosyltransferase involved in cell wall biosynthesis